MPHELPPRWGVGSARGDAMSDVDRLLRRAHNAGPASIDRVVLEAIALGASMAADAAWRATQTNSDPVNEARHMARVRAQVAREAR